MSKIKKIVLSAMLLAILLVLSRFLSIKTQLLVISFSFVPIMLSGMLLGPKYSMIIAALGDLIGALLFPFGSYFPGFTLSQAIIGFIYGAFLYENNEKKMSDKKFIIMLIISSVLALGLVNILLTSLWLKMLYGSAYTAVLATRVVPQLIMLPIQVIVMFALRKLLMPVINKYLY